MRKSMKKSSNGISQLPDDILGSILCFLPKKHAIRTSILSKRWTNLWKSTWIHATNFDFGKEFALAQTHEQCATTVNKYLQLHRGNNIEIFRLYFPLNDQQYRADLEKWIEFATSKEVKELDLTLCKVTEKSFMEIPAILFSCSSFISLSLSRVDFKSPSGFTGFGSLQTLQLNQVSITDEALETLVSNCLSLRNLCLRLCVGLRTIKISSMNLRCLSVIFCDCGGIDIFAPNLKSLHFYGDIMYQYCFRNVATLEDFFISADGCEFTEPEHDFIHILSSVSHIKVLTTCIGAPMRITLVEEYVELGPLPVALPNLQELQIVIGGKIGEEYLGYVFNFFKHTVFPLLEKIFIDLSGPYTPTPQYDVEQAKVPGNCVFDNLKIVKINQFRGTDTEMKMVKFFLQRASVLELLVLVFVSKSPAENDVNNERDGDKISHSGKSMKLLVDELLSLPNSSNKVQIVLFDHGEVDTSLSPVHNHTDYLVDLVEDIFLEIW